jgi:hypothetical protein
MNKKRSISTDTRHVQAEPAYGNWKMLAPDGHMMCRCTQRRAEWYLSRGIATVTGENEFTLKFEPQGPGNDKDPFYLKARKNICVVCGSVTELTQHHCVPKMYRKYLPNRLKSRESHDLVLVCADCHDRYEPLASELKRDIAQECGMPREFDVTNNVIDHGHCEAVTAAGALTWKPERIPQARKDYLVSRIREIKGVQDVTPDYLNKLAKEPKWIYPDGMKINDHGKKVLHHFRHDYHGFIRRWRQHFVDTMQPKFLPEGWSVDFISHRNRELEAS